MPTTLTPGDIAIIGYNTTNPDSIRFILLVDITTGTTFNVTDNGWQSNGSFTTTEGILTYTAPSNISAGTVLTWTNGSSNNSPGFNSDSPFGFAFNTNGDSVTIYTGTLASPTLIYALNSGTTGWSPNAINPTTSAEPTSANNGTLIAGTSTVAILNANGYYSGSTTSGTKAQLLSAISNPANWTASSSITNLSNWQSSFTVNTVTQPDLTINLSASPNHVTAGTGNILTYTITVSNNGNANATGVNVDFNLPTGIEIISIPQTSGFQAQIPPPNSSQISFTNGSINAGSNATLTIQVVPYNAGNLTSGTAVIDPTNTITESNENNNTAAAVSTTVNPGLPNLNVGTSTPGPITAGVPFNYTLDVQNNGGANASGVTLQFTLPANVTYNSANILGGGFSEPIVTGNVLTFNGGSINAGNFAQILVNVTPTVAGSLGSGTLVADPNSTINESNEVDNSINTAIATVNPGIQPDLTISLSDSPDPVTVGNNLTYTLTVNNNGTGNASGINVNFTLPTGLSVVGTPGVSNSFTYTGTIGGVAKFTGGSINAGGNATLTLEVTPNNAGVLTSGSAIVDPNNSIIESNESNNNAVGVSTNVNAAPQPNLTISVSDSPDPVTVGNNLTYTLTVNNNGTGNASGVDVNFTLPTGLSVVGTPGVSNSFTYTGTIGGVAKFTGGSINAGSNAILTLQVTPNNAGVLTSGIAIVDPNNSIIESNESDNNAAAITTTVNGITAPTKINQIQGNGATSPLINTVQTIEGIVVGDFQTPTATGGLGGFFLQEETADEDGNPLTSEGIFVFADNSFVDVSEGQKVRVTGVVSETFGQTQITPTNAATIQIQTGGSLAQITPATVNLPFVSNTFVEQFEGMRVKLPQTLTVSDTFNLVRFGELTLSNGRLFQPTNIVSHGAAANSQQAANELNKIIIDDGRNGAYQTPFAYGFNAANPIRTGQNTTNIEGVLSYDFNNYRIHPTITPNFIGNTRTTTPENVGGNIKVASFNLLNYFNGSTFPTSRGATTSAEFTRQRNKTIDAILKMNSDIIGVMELENDGYGTNSAIQDLINGLNSSPNKPAGVNYAFINPGLSQLGGDEITVGLIYNFAKVSPVGNAAILSFGAFNQDANSLHRPALAQTFQDITSGGKFTTVVNHFKSKGSAPASGDPNADQGDGQGAWNLARTQAANQLTAWLATDPTNSGDSDFLIIGDLNSYAKEDPITVIKNRGYTNLIEQFVGTNSYSFVFQGQAGYLDHALSSSSLTSQVTGATEWHINADESPLIDYNEESFPNSGPAKPADFYNADAYRSSDHDPIVLGINLTTPNISIQAIDPNASEAGNDGGTFRISRSGGGSVGALNVTYTVTGQATSNDYNPSLTGVATIAAGQSFVDVTIIPVDDSSTEGNETVIVNLVDTADYNLSANNSATVTIADNDTVVLPPPEPEKCSCYQIEDMVNHSYNGTTFNPNPPDDFILNDDNDNYILAGLGKDTIFGRSGDDFINGNQDADIINGNRGNDTIHGGKGNDFIRGGKNNDVIYGDLDKDTLCGDLGNDNMFGMLGDDILIGSEGDDILNGNQGNDTVCGGEGNDLVRGGQNNDSLCGCAGDDTIFGDLGNDTLCGGEGNDIFGLRSNSGFDIIKDFTIGKDLLGLTGGLSFTQLTIAQQGQDTLIRITATNEILASLTGVTASLITANAIVEI
jgi:uncharacterized repeat protein (TIGR01451 family)